MLRFSCAAALAALLGASFLTAGGCNQSANKYVQPPPPAVTVAQPVEQEIVHQLEFTGTTRPTEAVEVRARVMGYLQKINFEDGAEVKAGDLLFVIEPAPFEAARDSAKAALQRAEAELKLARADLTRAEPLVQRGALTPQELDLRRANVATADAGVASAQAQLRQAELELSYTQVKSPISGRVSRHLVDVGNLVQAQQTVLTRVEAYDPIHVYFAVSESDVLQFMRAHQGVTAAAIADEAPKIYMGLSGEIGFPHEGRLDFAELGVDPDTGTQMRRGVFPNPDRKLLPGLFARVRFPVGEPHPGLMVPDRAIGTDQRGEYVLVVNDKNVVEYRSVTLGMRIAGMRVVAEGVQRGDWIVINGLQRARPGSPVNPEKTQDIPEAKNLQAANDPAIPQVALQAARPAETAGGN
ncbi:MAG: efflux RND transporter periplasmic adaptor subunit [Pirellulales bacterium]|nr:efflux RND transporter periplasmic adaptor subunit [Pirellulales bacterium]